MKCPNCKSANISTIDSRTLEKHNSIRRRKKCDQCGHRWSTYEISKSMITYYEEQLKRLQDLEYLQRRSGSNQGVRKHWSKSEVDLLLVMYFEQASAHDIAVALNRSYSSINNKLWKLHKSGKLSFPSLGGLESGYHSASS